MSDDGLTRLVAFASAAAGALEARGVQPVVYGSLAFLAHTGDASFGVHDVDFLVPAADRERIGELLAGLPGLRIEATSYHSTKVHRDDLKLAFDGVEQYLAGLAFQWTRMRVAGHDFAVLDRASLEIAYERGAATIPAKAEAYAEKLQRLRAAAR